MVIRKLLTSLGWVGGSTLIVTLLQLSQVTILTRLLTPQDFGLVAITVIIFLFLQIFHDSGFSNAIIQAKNVNPKMLNSVLIVNIALTLLICGFVLIFAKNTSLIFVEYDDDLNNAINILTPTIILGALSSIYNAMLRKEMNFKIIALYRIMSVFSGFATSIALALYGIGFMSLVFGMLVQTILNHTFTIYYGMKHLYLPKLRWNYSSIHPIFSFGIYQLMERLLNYVTSNIDKSIIALFLGATALGYYHLAWTLVIFPVAKVNPMLINILYPIYCDQKIDVKSLSILQEKIYEIAVKLWFPIFFYVGYFSDNISDVIFSTSAEGVSEILPFLVITGFTKVISALGVPLLLSHRKANITFYWNIFTLLLLNASIAASVWWTPDLVILAIVIMCVSIFCFPIWHVVIYFYTAINILRVINHSLKSILFSISVILVPEFVLKYYVSYEIYSYLICGFLIAVYLVFISKIFITDLKKIREF